jgi:hypothetical protein
MVRRTVGRCVTSLPRKSNTLHGPPLKHPGYVPFSLSSASILSQFSFVSSLLFSLIWSFFGARLPLLIAKPKTGLLISVPSF